MLERVCYLGDDDLGLAAVYLAGVMTHYGIAFDYVPSPQSPATDFTARRYALYVLSDYPAARWQAGQLEHVVECVRGGSGLLMLGGWESFHGRLGEYHRTPLAAALPVRMGDGDDRVNCAQPCLVHKSAEHEILAGLPWQTPPGIGGYNRFTPKPDATTLLECMHYAVRLAGDGAEFSATRRAPLLVVGQHGAGRTAALATDVAPHWVGGWVDWGDQRVFQEVGPGFIEVGNWYAQFFRNLVAWTGRLAGSTPLR
jgi:hypothetical protein